jgi:uncharacterized protein (TIGR03118 family)
MRIIHSIVVAAAALCAACSSASPGPEPSAQSSEALGHGHEHVRVAQRMVQTNLVANLAGKAAHTDPNLANAWGLAFNPAGPAWVSDNHTGLTTVYDATGALKLTVTIPPPEGGTPPSAPTGQAFNGDASAFGGDRFIFVTEDGTISGWQPAFHQDAVRHVDRSAGGTIYKGMTLAQTNGQWRLFAADFHNGKVDVFDASYAPVAMPGCFHDPFLPRGYAPFNVQVDGHLLIVTYAEQDADAHDDAKGPGHGFVDLYDTDGRFLQRLLSRGALNSPWGVAIAPPRYGHIGRRLLVGNFGDGRINVYELDTFGHHVRAEHEGVLGDMSGAPLVIEGLWAIGFAPDAGGFSSRQLYFTAGPNDEQDGVFGRLELP